MTKKVKEEKKEEYVRKDDLIFPDFAERVVTSQTFRGHDGARAR